MPDQAGNDAIDQSLRRLVLLVDLAELLFQFGDQRARAPADPTDPARLKRKRPPTEAVLPLIDQISRHMETPSAVHIATLNMIATIQCNGGQKRIARRPALLDVTDKSVALA